MTIIERLNLTQDRVNLDPGESTQRWYGWSTATGVSWGPGPNSPAGRGPDYACDVTIPAILSGDADEARADIAQALRRHARALGLD